MLGVGLPHDDDAPGCKRTAPQIVIDYPFGCLQSPVYMYYLTPHLEKRLEGHGAPSMDMV